MDSNVRYLVAYGVIKASGTIETVMKQMVFDHLSQSCNSEAIQYFTKYVLASSANPSFDKICKILGEINNAWKKLFKSYTSSTRQQIELDSLVELRNTFAHGGTITASIEDIIHYFISGIWILDRLSTIVDP